MRNSLHNRGPVSLAFCLLVPSALSAQDIVPEQPPYYYQATPRIGGNPLRGRESPPESPHDAMPAVPTVPPEGLREMPPVPPYFPGVDVQRFRLVEQQRFEQSDLGWVRYILYALIALLGGWGASRFPKEFAPVGSPPRAGARTRTAPPPQKPLGLGADGKGGVWLRQVFPWEQE
jgi:hypothetical protein